MDRNPLNRLESSGYDREAAEQDLKDTAIEASQHSSGDVLDMASKDSKYAHGNEHLLRRVDENTTLPSTDTTVSGAYTIGKTDSSEMAQNYTSEIPQQETRVAAGTGSRTIQTLPSHVQDMGTTVQTNRTRHIVETEKAPVQYIPPSSNVVTGSGAGYTTTTSTTSTGRATGAQYDTGVASGATHGVGHHTTGLPAGQSGVVQHHGIVGENKTIDPANEAYTLNAGSGAAVGTSMLGIPHGTTGVPATGHSGSTTTSTSHTPEKKKKESMMDKLKHAIGK